MDLWGAGADERALWGLELAESVGRQAGGVRWPVGGGGCSVAGAWSLSGRRCAADFGGRLGWLCVLSHAFVPPCVSVRSGVGPHLCLSTVHYCTVACVASARFYLSELDVMRCLLFVGSVLRLIHTQSRSFYFTLIPMVRKRRRSEGAARLRPLGEYLDEQLSLGRLRCATHATALPPCDAHVPAEELIDGVAHLIHCSTLPTACDSPFFCIPLPDRMICISDHGNGRLVVISPDGVPLLTLSRSGHAPGELMKPLGVALGSTGSLYVADSIGRVQQLDDGGSHVRTYAASSESACTSGQGREAFGRLEAWLPHGGTARAGLVPPSPPVQPGELCSRAAALGDPSFSSSSEGLVLPCGVAEGPGGRLYVSDRATDRIVCFGSDGQVAFSFGSRGTGASDLHDPRGLAVYMDQIWVADMCNHRVSVFSLRGTPVRRIGRFGDRPAEFRHPSGVAFAADLLMVSEYSGGRVQALSLRGECLQIVRAPFAGACVCAVGANARIVSVMDTEARCHVFRLARRGPQQTLPPPPLEDEHADGGPLRLALAPVLSAASAEAARRARLLRTRPGRVQLALEAADYAGVMAHLNADDLAALVPEALAHAASEPARYKLPPERSADSLVAEFEEHLAGRAAPIGPPHW